MDSAELNRLCARPGYEGSLWRLVRAWDPDQIRTWLIAERTRGITPEQAVNALAEVMSAAIMTTIAQMGGDKRGAIFGQQGLMPKLAQLLNHKMNTVGGRHIVTPKKPPLIIPGGNGRLK